MKQNKEKNKRIVFFDATLQSGGAERVISILTQYLQIDGYQVEILLYHDQPIFYTMSSDIKITSVEKETNSTNIFKNIIWIHRFFKKYADVIVSFLAPFNMLALVAHFGLKSKIIVADRNDPRFIPRNFILRQVRNFLYLLADGIVLQTQRNKNYFFKLIKAKSTVIYNPIDLGNKCGQALKTTKLDKIVCVGRLILQKNQSLLLKAFSLIQTQFPTYKLIFYGKGPQQRGLEIEAEKLGISKYVCFAGNTKNIFDEISNAKLFVLCSNYEGMPNVLIEAMCLGLPVISTDVSGSEELIVNGKSGFIVPRNSPKKLAEIMKKILLDTSLQKRLGEQALNLNDKLKISSILNQWKEFIKKTENR